MLTVNSKKLSGWKSLLCLNHKKVRIIWWNAVVGKESDSQTDARQIDQKIIAAKLCFRHQIQVMLLEQIMEKFTGSAFFPAVPGRKAGVPSVL